MFDARSSVLTRYGWKEVTRITTRDQIAGFRNNERVWLPVEDIKILPYTDTVLCTFDSGSLIMDQESLTKQLTDESKLIVGRKHTQESADTETLIQVSKLLYTIHYANILKRRRVKETCIKTTNRTPECLVALLQLEAYSHEISDTGCKIWIEGLLVQNSVKQWMLQDGIHISSDIYATLLADIYEELDGRIEPHPTSHTMLEWVHALACKPYILRRTPNKGYCLIEKENEQEVKFTLLKEPVILADIDVDAEQVIVKGHLHKSPILCYT